MSSIIAIIPQWYIITYVVLFGLCFGSLTNVIILRGLSGEDLIFQRSKCPKCQNQLKWYMNIPLLSYIFLGGKCAYCKEKISIQYPIVELAVCLLFLFSYYKLGLNLKLLYSFVFIIFSISMFVTDLKEKVILDIHAYIITLFGLIYAITTNEITLIKSITGAILGFLFFEIISRISEKILSQRMFGTGDSLIAMAYGSIVGIKMLLILFTIAILVQSFCAIPVLAYKNFKEKNIKLCLSYIVIVIAITLMILNYFFNLIANYTHYLIFITIVIATLLWSLKNLIKEIKEKKEKFDSLKLDDIYDAENPYSLFPFGPALIIAFFICFYYKTTLINLINNFIG